MMGVIIAALSIILLCVIIISATRRITSKLQLSLPKKVIKKEIKKKRRTENMSQAREGVTFNDIFMFMIAVPLVLLWVGFAGFVIHSGLNDASVLDQIEGYTTLIAILGGPALLIIKDALDVWKQEQAEKTAFYKSKAQAVIDYNASAQKQSQLIESNEQAHEHKVVKTVTKKK
jgi:sterol desaturase/sphingolipid hydroxylase (fatty acid hydroxylase superfamily)|tara:strand:+ start:106 stop:627 length:522 start_codon:yes stop_codon:yes gene_type:complete